MSELLEEEVITLGYCKECQRIKRNTMTTTKPEVSENGWYWFELEDIVPLQPVFIYADKNNLEFYFKLAAYCDTYIYSNFKETPKRLWSIEPIQLPEGKSL